MKRVTKERIIKALSASHNAILDKPEYRVVQALASIGLRSAFGLKDPSIDADRLELIYQGFSDTAQVFRRLSRYGYSELNSVETMKKAWIDSWERLLEKKRERDQKILKIQKLNQISGLNEAQVILEGETLKFHEPDMDLCLIESDLDVLYSERMVLASAFARASRRRQLFQCSDGEWLLSDADVEAISARSRWAQIWVDGCEYHIAIESAPDVNSDVNSVWFCSRVL